MYFNRCPKRIQPVQTFQVSNDRFVDLYTSASFAIIPQYYNTTILVVDKLTMYCAGRVTERSNRANVEKQTVLLCVEPCWTWCRYSMCAHWVCRGLEKMYSKAVCRDRQIVVVVCGGFTSIWFYVMAEMTGG